VLDQNARVVAKFADGTAAACEHLYGKGSATLLGTFAGQQNEAKPVAMHPRGEILAKWAGFAQPEWKARALVELRGMDGEKGKFVFLFNHGAGSRSAVCGTVGAAVSECSGGCGRRNAENQAKTIHREDGSSGAGSAHLPDRLLKLMVAASWDAGTTRRRGRRLAALRACPWFSWRAGTCE
jgi:hypothetical protein